MEEENDYELKGNWDTAETKMFSINIARCN